MYRRRAGEYAVVGARGCVRNRRRPGVRRWSCWLPSGIGRRSRARPHRPVRFTGEEATRAHRGGPRCRSRPRPAAPASGGMEMSDETDIGNAIEDAANAVFGDDDTRGGPGHGRRRRLRLEPWRHRTDRCVHPTCPRVHARHGGRSTGADRALSGGRASLTSARSSRCTGVSFWPSRARPRSSVDRATAF